MYADIIIINGKCITMEADEQFDWIAIKKDKIYDLGKGDDYFSLIGVSSIVINARGKTVLPGFIDSHFHVIQTAMNEDSIDLNSAYSYEDIGEKIKLTEKENPGEVIFAVRLDKENLKEKAYPDRHVLDKFSSNVPIWINNVDYQISILNTYGLLFYKIPFRMEGIEVDKNGVATGIFRGKANAILRKRILDNYPNKKRHETVEELMPNLLNVGITTINAMEGGYMYSDKDADFIYERKSEFPVDMALFYQSLNLEKVKEKNLSRIGGSLYIDGTIGARTAALTFEYNDYKGKMGSMIFSQEELNEFVAECYIKHLQLSLYTIGDRAIEAALNAHEYALHKTGIKGLRHRMEHVILATIPQIQKASRLGIIFSMNPTYETFWGGKGKMYNERLGEGYVETNKFREILDNGVVLCGGSDSDVCPYNPFIGIHGAVNHPVAKHRITPMEALRMYTINGAYGIFEEKIKGSLAKGKLADVIVLNQDLSEVKDEDLDKVKVVTTIKSGEVLQNRI